MIVGVVGEGGPLGGATTTAATGTAGGLRAGEAGGVVDMDATRMRIGMTAGRAAPEAEGTVAMGAEVGVGAGGRMPTALATMSTMRVTAAVAAMRRRALAIRAASLSPLTMALAALVT